MQTTLAVGELDLELLDSKPEAQMSIDDWPDDYNTYGRYQSLGWG